MRALGTIIFIVGIFSLAIFLSAVLPKPSGRYLVIHADDAGMYPSVNAATIEAVEKGLVSSCSIMVPCPAFAEFASYAATHPNRDFGVHLTLNCDTKTFRWGPVCPKRTVPSLVDPNGFFWSTTQETARHARIDDVERELRAQIDKALASGIRITHLDNHMFVMAQRPDFLRLYVQLGLDYNLPIQYVEQGCLGIPPIDDPEILAVYREGLERLRARGMPVFQDIDANNYNVPPEQKRAYFLTAIQNLKPGVTEFVIHCANGPVAPMHAPNADRREADLRMFISREAGDCIRRCHVEVIDWKSFRKLHENGWLR